MAVALKRTMLFAAYQLSLIAGLLLLPLALALQRAAGIMLPVHRVIDSARDAYEQALHT